jgi:hypothetical protein
MTQGILLSRNPDLTGWLVCAGLLVGFTVIGVVLALRRLRRFGSQPEAADYGDDEPRLPAIGNEEIGPPSPPER